MFIYSRETLDSTELVNRQLLVSYLDADELLVQPLLNALSRRGIKSTPNCHSEFRCRQDNYIERFKRSADDCSVAVICLSKATFAPEFEVHQQLLWYEIGYLLSRQRQVVLFFLDISREERNEFLKTTPVRQMQGSDSIDELVTVLQQNNIREKVFYDDPEVNRYASRRINYVKLTTLLHLYEQDLEDILDDLRDNEGIDYHTRQGVFHALMQEMRCGCTVTSFNSISHLGKEVEPYYPEVATLVRDYPVQQEYSRPMRLDNTASNNIFATIRLSFVLPIHSLLGVTFKPFLSLSSQSDFSTEHLKTILASNSAVPLAQRDPEERIDRREQRLYFLLDLDVRPSEGGDAVYGEKLNHLWPA